ncbi:MAG: hypothetical protein KAH46_05890 [Mycobacterium sp.]|nr:hypothetical protein [Mycobacterium sp.]
MTANQRFRGLYGSHPAHLLLMLAGLAAFIAVIATMTPAALWNPQSWWQSIGVWFVIAVVAHDLVAFPLYAAADRILTHARPLPRTTVPLINYLRVPALAATLTFVLFLPGIIEQGEPAYRAATGQTQQPFLARWLWLTAAFYAATALTYGVRLSLARRRRSPRNAATGSGADSPTPR